MKQKQISTGLCDSRGNEIFIGDHLKIPTTINKYLHGDWAIYKVKQKGIIPIVGYIESEKGQVIPKGMMSCFLTDYYDRKLLLEISEILRLRPDINFICLKDWFAGT